MIQGRHHKCNFKIYVEVQKCKDSVRGWGGTERAKQDWPSQIFSQLYLPVQCFKHFSKTLVIGILQTH